MIAKFDEIPGMTLQDFKETKCYGRTQGQTYRQRENSIPTTNKVCRGYKIISYYVIFNISADNSDGSAH